MSAPFLLLQTRPEDALADAEYEAFVRLSGLEAGDVERFRLEAAPLPAGFENTWHQRYSALVLGGSPFTSTVLIEAKPRSVLRKNSRECWGS